MTSIPHLTVCYLRYLCTFYLFVDIKEAGPLSTLFGQWSTHPAGECEEYKWIYFYILPDLFSPGRNCILAQHSFLSLYLGCQNVSFFCVTSLIICDTLSVPSQRERLGLNLLQVPGEV